MFLESVSYCTKFVSDNRGVKKQLNLTSASEVLKSPSASRTQYWRISTLVVRLALFFQVTLATN